MEQITIPATLTLRQLKLIFVYLGILFILSIIGSIWGIQKTYSITSPIISNILVTCSLLSISSSSLYYLRKLYKLSLSTKINIEIVDSKDKLKNIGTITYFIFRPLSSIIFTIIIILGIRCGGMLITNTTTETSLNQIDFFLFISFFTGFSNGKFIKYLEKKSTDIIDNLS